LVEVTCVVVAESSGVSLPELVDCLLEGGFTVLAASRRTITPEVAEAYADIHDLANHSGHHERQDGSGSALRVQRGGCIAVAAGARVVVMAEERDNAETCSEMLLARGPLKRHYGTTVLSSRSQSAAEAHLNLFFSS